MVAYPALPMLRDTLNTLRALTLNTARLEGPEPMILHTKMPGSLHRPASVIYAARSKRSAVITLVQAATKSRANFSPLSSWA